MAAPVMMDMKKIEEPYSACYTISNKKKAVAVINSGLMLPNDEETRLLYERPSL